MPYPVLETMVQFPTFSSSTPLVIHYALPLRGADGSASKEDHELSRTVVGQKVVARLFPVVRTWWDAIEMAVLKGGGQAVPESPHK
jgi:hypothetical protein